MLDASPARRGTSRHETLLGVCGLLFVLPVLLAAGASEGALEPAPPVSPLDEPLRALEQRLGALEQDVADLRSYHAAHVEPLVDFLEANAWPRIGAPGVDDRPEIPPPAELTRAEARRIALALLKEGRRAGIDPRLLAAVLMVENPWLDPHIESPVGAVGLMQVMPFHVGSWPCARTDLTHVETNVCHGASILAYSLRRSGGDLDRALLRYNGCRAGTNTSDCRAYPSKVYTFAGPDWMKEIEEAASDPAVRSALTGS